MNADNSEKFEVTINAVDSINGRCVDDTNVVYKNLTKDQVNGYIANVNNFNTGNDFDESIVEDMFKNWYAEHCSKHDSLEAARDYFDDGAGHTNGWAIEIDVFDANGCMIDLVDDDGIYDNI